MKTFFSLRQNYKYVKIVKKFSFSFSDVTKRSQFTLMERNWLEYLHNNSSNPNKKAFMDISSNKKEICLNDLKIQLKDKELIAPFTSKKNINFKLFEIYEGRAKILLAHKKFEYDPEAKYDFFIHYNLVSVYLNKKELFDFFLFRYMREICRF